jgi:hypothetical protein
MSPGIRPSIPTLAVSLLAFAATRAGRRKKERLGTAEGRKGRSASQVAANLGLAALVASSPCSPGSWIRWLPHHAATPTMLFALAVAALAEAAADTVSSEIGQVLGWASAHDHVVQGGRSRPRRRHQRGRLLAGVVAAAIVAYAGMWALGGGWSPVYGELRRGRLRPFLRQPAGSHARGTRLAEQRRGEFSCRRPAPRGLRWRCWRDALKPPKDLLTRTPACSTATPLHCSHSLSTPFQCRCSRQSV